MNWQEANKQYLMAAIRGLRGQLEGKRGWLGRASTSPAAELAKLEAEMPAPPAIRQLQRLFGLSEFERDLILLCAGAELDSEFSRMLGRKLGEENGASPAGSPTFGLAMACIPEAHWNALLPAAPLRYWRIIEVDSHGSLVHARLRIDERILHFLTGSQYLDQRLDPLIQKLSATSDLPPSQRLLAERVAGKIAGAGGPFPIIGIYGQESAALRAIAAEISSNLKLGLYAMYAGEIPAVPADRTALARLWEREASLTGSVLLLDAGESEGHQLVNAFAERLECPLFIASRWPLSIATSRSFLRVGIEKPNPREQQEVWAQSLGEYSKTVNGFLPALTAQYDLTGPMIRAACSEAIARIEPAAEAAAFKASLWDSCREQGRRKLDELAHRIQSSAGWKSLILPKEQTDTLRQIIAHVRNRRTVYEQWGFAERSSRGLGLSVIFAGPSGTGKTLATEVLANELKLDLYRIDLSQVVSKYIGETEKNLRRIFDAAENGGAILLFDEADALFGKRSEVKDSHDRYANLEVSFLLQQMESYRGLAILTTNQLQAFDQAFMRRVRFIVQFPFPGQEQRAEIWSSAFPPDAPTERLDCAKLSRLNLAGGNISNITMNAAFLAAEAAQPIRMEHLLRATISEYAKLEKTLSAEDIRDWIDRDPN
ncbi:MAG: ATP-binding protein [Blastocatellia bacterium]|nr:ATP-binding protein [Blastocatellia bacterium]